MKPIRKPTEKLLSELRLLRDSRKSIDDYNYNFLANFYDCCKFMHLQIGNPIGMPMLNVAYRQYYVFLISCWETFFRDVFVLVHTKEKDLLNQLVAKLKNYEESLHLKPDDITTSELVSKCFNFQNLDDLNNAFSTLIGSDFLDYVCKQVIPSCAIKGKHTTHFSIEHLFANWRELLTYGFKVRHNVVHDANYRPEFDAQMIQKVEALFLLIPQVATYFIAIRFNLPLLCMVSGEVNLGPAFFIVDEILADDWEVVA